MASLRIIDKGQASPRRRHPNAGLDAAGSAERSAWVDHTQDGLYRNEPALTLMPRSPLPMNVYFTVDTESSMGGAWACPENRPLKAERHIFCRINGEDHGIGLITRLLKQRGFRATHFIEMLATLVNGEDDTRSVFDYLLEHEQDVQLHIHPSYRFYSEAIRARAAGQAYVRPEPSDFIAALDEKLQLELLEQASMLYRRFTGRNPVAFRAGCYAANRATLRSLRSLGLLMDSSFNPCYSDVSFPNDDIEPNQVRRIEGIWELPVTVARTPLPEGYRRLKPADPCALSVNELRTMLEFGVQRGQRHFVMIFHSFSAVKAKDERYDVIRPDRIIIRRLGKLLDYLAQHPEWYRVTTFGEIAAELPCSESVGSSIAELGLASAGLRKSVQALNRFYWF